MVVWLWRKAEKYLQEMGCGWHGTHATWKNQRAHALFVRRRAAEKEVGFGGFRTKTWPAGCSLFFFPLLLLLFLFLAEFFPGKNRMGEGF
jgi:hypothetical protein